MLLIQQMGKTSQGLKFLMKLGELGAAFCVTRRIVTPLKGLRLPFPCDSNLSKVDMKHAGVGFQCMLLPGLRNHRALQFLSRSKISQFPYLYINYLEHTTLATRYVQQLKNEKKKGLPGSSRKYLSSVQSSESWMKRQWSVNEAQIAHLTLINACSGIFTSRVSGCGNRIRAIFLCVCLSVNTITATLFDPWPWFLVWELYQFLQELTLTSCDVTWRILGQLD